MTESHEKDKRGNLDHLRVMAVVATSNNSAEEAYQKITRDLSLDKKIVRRGIFCSCTAHSIEVLRHKRLENNSG